MQQNRPPSPQLPMGCLSSTASTAPGPLGRSCSWSPTAAPRLTIKLLRRLRKQLLSVWLLRDSRQVCTLHQDQMAAEQWRSTAGSGHAILHAI